MNSADEMVIDSDGSHSLLSNTGAVHQRGISVARLFIPDKQVPAAAQRCDIASNLLQDADERVNAFASVAEGIKLVKQLEGDLNDSFEPPDVQSTSLTSGHQPVRLTLTLQDSYVSGLTPLRPDISAANLTPTGCPC